MRGVAGRVWTAAHEYALTVRSEGAGLATLRALVRGGPFYWLGLAALLIALPLTAILGRAGNGLPTRQAELWPGEAITVTVAALWAALALMALGWAYLLAGAASFGLGAYVPVAAYAAYYGLAPGGALAGRAWFATFPLWLLAQGAWLASMRPGRWRRPLLLVLSLLLATLLGEALLGPRLGANAWGQTGLGLAMFALVANRWALRPRPYRPRVAFVVTLSLLLAFYPAAITLSPPEQLPGLTFLALHHLLGALGLFWYWLGLDLFQSAGRLAGWAARTARALLPRVLLPAVIVAGWLLALGVAALLTLKLPALWGVLTQTGMGRALWAAYLTAHADPLLIEVAGYGLYLTLAIVLLALGLWAARRLAPGRLVSLWSGWLLGLLILWGGLALMQALVLPTPQQASGWWPLLLYVGGMFWSILQNSDNLVAAGEGRLGLFTGFLLCLAGVTLFEVSAGYGYFETELSLNALGGVLYLGLPYLAYTALYRRARYTPVVPAHLATLFGLGLLSAIPTLAGAPAWMAAPLWLGALLVVIWRQGRWDDPLDGPVYALAVGLGYIVFYARPEVLPLPGYGGPAAWFAELQAGYAGHVLLPWATAWWILLGRTLLATVALGGCLGWAHRLAGLRRWVWAALGATLAGVTMGL